MIQRPPAGTIPDAPGSYQFKDADGRVIYVGKAKSLRSRLSNYFVNPATLPPRTAQMVATAETVEWIQVRNDVEALMLEYSLIKQHRPRFNVRLRDDKSYPFMAVTMDDEWPRPMVMRGKRRKGVRYFGPYGHAYAIRETLDLLLRTFPVRTCSDNKFAHHERQGRPCLLFHIEKCSGPCVGEIDKAEDLTDAELVSKILEGLYYEDHPLGPPKQVLVPSEPDDVDLYQRWLTECRGSAVTIRVPQRGDKRTLQDTVTQNAKEEFVRHRLRRSSDHNSRARALNELQDQLGLPVAPLRIECYDMSHIQGSDYVGSMVVVEDALPKKSDYRRFKIKDVPGNDDFAAMEEVLTRRLTAYLIDKDKPPAERTGKFSYPPQLLLVDGGKGQLSVAVRVVEELGLAEEIPVASLAKRFEEVFVPGQSDAIRIPRQSEALYLLQRIRDEAHRFAITYHRELRGKRMTKSVLDDVPGLGPTRKKRLVKELGGVGAVKQATLEELEALPWLPEKVAHALHEKLHGAP